MKFFWFGVVLLAFCVVCEVLSDFSESMLPSKEIRNRVHRTMRVNMRVGKRFGDSEYDDEAPKRRLRLRFRTGKRTFYDVESPDTNCMEPQESLYNTDSYDKNLLGEEPSEVDKRDFLSPNRRLRLTVRPGKRNSEGPHQTATNQDSYIEGPIKIRRIVRIGKRTLNAPDIYSSLTSQPQLPTESTEDTALDANNMNTDILAF